MAREPMRWYDWAALALLIVIILALKAAHAHWAYGDWKCGMPGVHCRKVK